MPVWLTQFIHEDLCYSRKFLIYNMVGRNLKLRYRRSALGFLWTILLPMGMGAMYYTVFSFVFKVQIPNYAAMIITGILFWTFFSQSLAESMDSFISNFGLVTKVSIPINVFAFSICLTNLITLFLAFPVIIGVLVYSGTAPSLSLLCLPYFALMLFFIAYFAGVAFSVAVVYFRDLKVLIALILQAWMYLTPILYHFSMVPDRYHWILYANPVGKAFAGINRAVTNGEWPTLAEFITPAAWALVFVVIGTSIKRAFADTAIERL